MPADPNDFTDKFNTLIPPEKQGAYDQWAEQRKASTGKDPRNDRYNYDVQGYWLSTGGATDDRGHGTDQFKKPNHPTFSTESQYSGADGNVGGEWIAAPGLAKRNPAAKKSDPAFYQPSDTNRKFMSPMGLNDYFNDPRVGDTNVVPLPPLDIHPPKINMQPVKKLGR